jgi:hypothetical protein
MEHAMAGRSDDELLELAAGAMRRPGEPSRAAVVASGRIAWTWHNLTEQIAALLDENAGRPSGPHERSIAMLALRDPRQARNDRDGGHGGHACDHEHAEGGCRTRSIAARRP